MQAKLLQGQEVLTAACSFLLKAKMLALIAASTIIASTGSAEKALGEEKGEPSE